MDPVTYFWLILKATLVSSTGLGNLPGLHQDFLARGWATEAQFGRAVAIGQVAPGPTGLWVVALGYLTFGWTGVILSALAATLPPLLVLGLDGLYRRAGRHPAVYGFVRGLSLGVAGIIPVVLLRILGHYGFDVWTAGIAAAAGAILLWRRLPPVAVLAAAAVVGVAVYR